MFTQLIRNRRSTRTFLKKNIEQDKIDTLVEVALRSPSSKSKNPWQFTIVTNPDTLQKLSVAKRHGAAFLADAPLAIVVTAEKDVSDVWVEDTSIAAILIQIAAEELGLGSCWIQLRKRKHSSEMSAEEYVNNTLELDPKVNVEAIIAIGYPEEKLPPHPIDSLQYEKVKFLN